MEYNTSYDIIIKSLFKQRPYLMLITYFTFTTTFLAYAVRMFERPFYDDPIVSSISEDDYDYQDYSLFNNAWWLIVVTMTTVGYGDYFPRTHLGRIVIILACFCGVFIVSLTVVTLTSASEFSRGEKLTYKILHRLRQRKTIERLAKYVIFYNIRYLFISKKLKGVENQKNVSLWTELRMIKDEKRRYEHRFYLKRTGLLQPDKLDHINYNYAKIQQKIGLASSIEETMMSIIEVQETEGNLMRFTHTIKYRTKVINPIEEFQEN